MSVREIDTNLCRREVPPLDAIRAKVEEVRREHALSRDGKCDLDECDRLKRCYDVQWAEAALKMAELEQTFRGMSNQLQMNANATAAAGEGSSSSIEAAMELDAQAFGLRRAADATAKVLASIAEGLK